MGGLAKLIRVTNDGLEIDGEAFPWYLTEAGATTKVSRASLPFVTVEIAAERVEVAHDLTTKQDEWTVYQAPKRKSVPPDPKASWWRWHGRHRVKV
jgi:hypothetical protein